MRALLLCLVSLTWPVAADVRLDPILAIPMTDAFFNDPVIRGFFADLLRQGGYGRLRTESAAFVVRYEDGTYQCVTWPSNAGFHRQRFRAAIPDRTVAIMHTHPRELPLPSANDRQTAIAFSVPIFVLTPRNIHLVMQSGSHVPVVTNHDWPVESSSRPCSPDARSASLTSDDANNRR